MHAYYGRGSWRWWNIMQVWSTGHLLQCTKVVNGTVFITKKYNFHKIMSSCTSVNVTWCLQANVILFWLVSYTCYQKTDLLLLNGKCYSDATPWGCLVCCPSECIYSLMVIGQWQVIIGSLIKSNITNFYGVVAFTDLIEHLSGLEFPKFILLSCYAYT